MASELTAEQLAELERIRSDLNDRYNPDEVGDHQCCFCGDDYSTTSSRGDMEDVGYCWTCATEKLEAISPMLPALIAAAKREAELSEENNYLQSRRGGECDTCKGWVCPPLRCVACMMTRRITPASDPAPLAAEALRKQDAALNELAARATAAEARVGELTKALEVIATCNTSPISPDYLSPERAKAFARTALKPQGEERV